MRLIDVDYAFKHLRGCVGKYPSTYAVGLLTAADEIAKIPTIEVPRWIPVAERLPEKAGEYLVAYNPCYWEHIHHDTILIGLDTFRGKTAWAKRKHQKVTHWMPLPDAPKDGDT